MGRIAFALILLAVGVGWLFESLGVIELPWDALLPAALIVVGAVLVAGSRTGRYSGLIALGIVLTITTAVVAAVDLPLVGGVGQRVITPQSAAELEPRYDLAVGQLVIDLTDLRLVRGDRVDIRARAGLGELVVEVPVGINVEVHARAGLGDIQILGEQASGFGPERIVRRRVDRRRVAIGPLISLDLSVGLGSVKVNQ
ncbi:MAG: LiaF domain-containing protein [Actinomycetota bacterium]